MRVFKASLFDRLICIMKDALEKGDNERTEHYIDLSMNVCLSSRK